MIVVSLPTQEGQLHQRPLLRFQHGSGASSELSLCFSDMSELVADFFQQPAELGEPRPQVPQAADQAQPAPGRRIPCKAVSMVVVNATLTASTPWSTAATSARSPAAIGEEDVRASPSSAASASRNSLCSTPDPSISPASRKTPLTTDFTGHAGAVAPGRSALAPLEGRLRSARIVI